MSTINDGGPAFPQMRVWNAERAEYEDTQQFPGMSMRDYAAVKFAASCFVSATGLGQVSKEDRGTMFEQVAAISYEAADAMLKARVSS